MKTKKLALMVVAMQGLAFHAFGIGFSLGDVFLGGGSGALGTIKHYNSSGTLLETISTGSGSEQIGMAFDAAGDLYATAFGASYIQKFSHLTGALVPPNPFVTNDSGSHNESIAFDSTGNFYVGQADGTKDIIKRAADGTFLARYDVATTSRGSDWIDLAADQKTMYYTSEGTTVKRYDVSTGTQLADFATLTGSNAFALRLLAAGGLLVADRESIKRLDSTGATVQTYDTAVPSGEDFFFALNLDPDGTSFWSAGYSSGKAYKFDIASGALLTTISSGAGVSGVAVYGERTIATGSVPDGGSSLALLGLALASVVGVRRKLKLT